VRDLYVEDALRRVAEDAANSFAELLASGEEIPYEVAEQPGEVSPLYRYAPKTAEFIRAHAPTIRELASFATARSAIAATSLASPYLEDAGLPVPAEPAERAEQLILLFLCRLWEDSVALDVEDDRFDAAISELWASASDEGATEVVVPIIGLRLSVARIALSEALLVHADTVDVPAEIKRSEGMDREAWEPQFLAVARIGDAGSGARPGGLGFRRLITTLRLFKEGGVGLAPHAWTRSGERWKRIATGASRPRSGGYQVADDEVAELVAFSRALDARRGRSRALSWAIARFEMGCERQNLLEALSDYVLALRGILEGGGPAEVGLSMRLAALCAEPADRIALKAMMDRALVLESSLMDGASVDDEEAGSSPLELAWEVEGQLRAILRDAACGHLGVDLRATADEILLADGVSAGEGAPQVQGETSEWRAGEEPANDAEDALVPQLGDVEPLVRAAARRPPEADRPQIWEEDRIGSEKDSDAHEPTHMETTEMDPEAARRVAMDRDEAEDWLEEVEEASRHTLEWPAFGEPRRSREDRGDAAERVRHLFPVPETTEWSIGELEYSRSRYDAER
jgi:hypothetical protein